MRYVIFDTETGGFDPATDALISLGAVVWRSPGGRVPITENLAGEFCPEFYSVVKDRDGRLDPGALRVNGFTRERIEAEGRDAGEVFTSFVNFCRHAGAVDEYGRIRLGGHNRGFDLGFLRRLARLAGSGARYDATFSHRGVCTMEVASFLLLALPGKIPGSGKLLDLVTRLGIEPQEAHNALGDARMAADLLTKLVGLVKE